MLQTLLARTAGLIRRESRDERDSIDGGTGRAGPDGARDAAGTEDGRSGRAAPDGGGTTASLYRCPTCDRTYVTDSMSACSRCEGDVERVPNEVELGLVGD